MNAVKRFDGGHFFLVNTDICAVPHYGQTFGQIVSVLTDRCVPVSFAALGKTGLSTKDVYVRYRRVDRRDYWWKYRYPRVILGVKNTDRNLFTLKDRYLWSGLIEPEESHRDWEEAYRSLVPVHLWDRVSSGKIQRQGEWLFVPTDLKFKRNEIVKWDKLGGTNHTPRDTVCRDGRMFVRGTVRHANRLKGYKVSYSGYLRRMVRLGNVWHEAVKLNFVHSWAGAPYWS